MDSFEVRRILLQQLGNYSAAGRRAAMTHEGVRDHLKRANLKQPLSARFTLHVPEGTPPEDAKAIIAFIYGNLARLGIERTPDPEGQGS